MKAEGRRDREAGVTLVEVLVALVLFALIGGAGLAMLDQVLRVQARTEGRLERLAEVQRALHLLTLDFMQASGGSLGFSEGAVAFQRGDGPAVRYGLDGVTLTRSVAGSAGEVRQVVLSGVGAASWQFYAPEAGWIDSWPPDPAKPAANPAAVSLTVSLDGPGLSGDLRRIALLPAEVGQ
jgi:general secretion pathway protein J